jgi:hypothetical protein
MANPAEPARPPQHPTLRPALGFVLLVLGGSRDRKVPRQEITRTKLLVTFGDPLFLPRNFGVDSLPTEKIVNDGWARGSLPVWNPFTPRVSIALPGPLVARERRRG